MKKFFALMLVVAMLSVTSSAMAVLLDTSDSKTEFTVVQGGTQTVTLKGTAQNGETSLVYSLIGAPSWVTIRSDTITISPTTSVTAGTSYTVYAKVTETVTTTTNDVGGHGTPTPVTTTRTYIATKPISIAVVAPVTNVQTIVRTVVKVVTEVISVVVPSTTDQNSMSVKTTFTESVQTTVETITTTVQAIVGLTQEEKAKWTAQAESIDKAQVAAAATVTSSTNAARDFGFTSTGSTPVTVPAPKTNEENLEEAVPLTASTNPVEVTAAAAQNANLSDTQVPVAAITPVKAKERGTQSFPQTTGRSFWGKPVRGTRGRVGGGGVAGGFAAAAADESGVAFLNSSGDVVYNIPDSGDPRIMPGYVNMLVVVEAGETYAPVMFTPSGSLDSTASANVSVDIVSVVSQDEEAQVAADGSVSSTPTASATVVSTMTTELAALGVSAPTKLDAGRYGTPFTVAQKTAEATSADNLNRAVAARVGKPLNNVPNGTYYTGIEFEGAPNRSMSANGAFEFRPNGATDSTTATAYVFDADGHRATAFGESLHGTKGYIVFTVSGTSVTAAEATLTNPTLTVALVDKGGSKTGDHGTSSSSGGCSAGSAALALAVLGSFIVMRKK